MLEQQAAQVGAAGIMGSDHTYVIPGGAEEPRRAGAAARKRSAPERCWPQPEANATVSVRRAQAHGYTIVPT